MPDVPVYEEMGNLPSDAPQVAVSPPGFPAPPPRSDRDLTTHPGGSPRDLPNPEGHPS